MTQETINRLMELKQLYEQGILTQEEMETEKQKILGTAKPTSEESPQEQPPSVDSHTVQPEPQEQPDSPTTDIANEESEENEEEGKTEILKIIVVVLAILLLGIIVYTCSHKNSNINGEEEANDSICVTDIDCVDEDYAYSSDTADDEFADDPFSRTYTIDGGVYRLCETRTILSLQKDSGDMYSGTIHLMCGYVDDEYYPERFYDTHGSIEGKVRGKRNGNEMIVVIDSYTIKEGSDYSLVSRDFKPSQQIFRLTYDGYSFSATALGSMISYFDGSDPEIK